MKNSTMSQQIACLVAKNVTYKKGFQLQKTENSIDLSAKAFYMGFAISVMVVALLMGASMTALLVTMGTMLVVLPTLYTLVATEDFSTDVLANGYEALNMKQLTSTFFNTLFLRSTINDIALDKNEAKIITHRGRLYLYGKTVPMSTANKAIVSWEKTMKSCISTYNLDVAKNTFLNKENMAALDRQNKVKKAYNAINLDNFAHSKVVNDKLGDIVRITQQVNDVKKDISYITKEYHYEIHELERSYSYGDTDDNEDLEYMIESTDERHTLEMKRLNKKLTDLMSGAVKLYKETSVTVKSETKGSALTLEKKTAK